MLRKGKRRESVELKIEVIDLIRHCRTGFDSDRHVNVSFKNHHDIKMIAI